MLLVQSSILIGSVLASGAAFKDVPGTHPNIDAINYILAQGIVKGYPDGSFKPDNAINRAEFTKIIIEAYFQGQATGSDCFPDVGTEWFAKYVCFAKARNIISGNPDGNFIPANDINFAEVSKILANANGSVVTAPAIPAIWYKPYVEKLAEANAIPTSITSFGQKVTRGEMAEVIYRLKAALTNLPSKTYEALNIENSVTIPTQERVSSGLPVRLKIPGINVDSPIEYVGLTADGSVDVPKDPANAAWYDLGPLPGDVGSSVITGHVDWWYGQKGVFENLMKVRLGDKIIVRNDRGEDISFVVRDIQNFDPAAVATDVFVSNDGKAHLNLITCEGVWIKSAQQYSQRLVVFTDRVTE